MSTTFANGKYTSHGIPARLGSQKIWEYLKINIEYKIIILKIILLFKKLS